MTPIDVRTAAIAPALSTGKLAAKVVVDAPASMANSKSSSGPNTFKEFEAVLLQQFVEAMMPSQSEAIFGKGVAGQTWKSLLSEKIAHELAASGQLGIAKLIESAAAANSEN